MSLIQTYNDGEGVTTVVWMDANFNPVKAGSDEAVHVKMIASTGEISFYRVDQPRDLAEWNEEEHPRDESGKFTDSGSSSSRAESRTKLSSGSPTSKETITGSANSVQKITLRDSDGNEVEAIFKPMSGESWTEEEMYEKSKEAMRERYSTEEFEQMEEDGEFPSGDPDEPVRETITNREFSYAAREVAAYEVDEAFGLGVVPPTVQREIDGQQGMVQEYVESSGLGAGDEGLDQDSVYGLAILDIATGNTDRHGGNVLIDKDRKVVAIDQGLSFPDDTDYGDNYQFRPDATISLLISNPGRMSKEMTERVSKGLASTDWVDLAKKWPMNSGERAQFLTRIGSLKEIFNNEEYIGDKSYGVRALISDMMLDSKIARQYDPKKIRDLK